MQIIADTHTHTCASTHAFSTITENCAAASAQGLRCIAMTDHFIRMPDAPHIWHFYSMVNLPRRIEGIYVLRGAEANILDADGGIDLTDEEFLPMAEWVVASIHEPVLAPCGEEAHTRAYIGAIENPVVDCIGHPDDAKYPFDHERVIGALREHGKLLEVNNARMLRKNPGTAKRYADMLRVCKRYEVSVVVNSDAHYHASIGSVEKSLALLDEIGFPERLVLNADWERFAAYVSDKRGNIFG